MRYLNKRAGLVEDQLFLYMLFGFQLPITSYSYLVFYLSCKTCDVVGVAYLLAIINMPCCQVLLDSTLF